MHMQCPPFAAKTHQALGHAYILHMQCPPFAAKTHQALKINYSLRVHSYASILNNICSESMSAARMCLYSIAITPRCTPHRCDHDQVKAWE